jgi:hypothetical protein
MLFYGSVLGILVKVLKMHSHTDAVLVDLKLLFVERIVTAVLFSIQAFI